MTVTSDQRHARTLARRTGYSGYVGPEIRTVVRRHRPAENLAYALRARAPEMPPDNHQQPTMATGSHLRT